MDLAHFAAKRAGLELIELEESFGALTDVAGGLARPEPDDRG
jgi:hypothetical protein